MFGRSARILAGAGIPSRSQIILSEPINNGLDTFRQYSKSNHKNLSASRVLDPSNQGLKDLAVHLIVALQALPVARLLPSVAGRGTLRSDLLRLELSTESDDFDLERIIPFLSAVLNDELDEVIWNKQTLWLRNTSSFANSTEHCKYVDDVLKEELGPMYVGIPRFFEAFFGEIAEPAAQIVFKRCKAGHNPLYQEKSGWQGWPEEAKESDPLQGSTADCKLDVGFVDNLSASVDSKCHWKQILVLGELKSNLLANVASKAWLDLGRYAREVLSLMRLWEFDWLRGIASTQFDINKDGLQFVSVLGFDPSIITAGDKRLIIDEGDKSRSPLVIKDSWQVLEREEEGKLLREATNKGVVNVARYYHYETVGVGSQKDDIHDNVQRGLDITQAKNYKPLESLMAPLSSAGRRILRKGRSSSAAERKRSSSCTGAPLPPSKQTCSTSLVKDYGKPIYKASSRVSLLAALEGCIDGYESLHTRAGVLQCDISPNNLISAFLIDLDLAIMEQREKSLGAQGKTGTRAFMAIGVLLDDKNHLFMHDLESFFWVLFWICVHYDGLGKDIGATEFECWNYESDQKLAELKLGLVSRERHFLNRITNAFTPYYQPLIPHVNRLRRNEDRTLYFRMKEILRNAQKDLEDLGNSEQTDK
ncbi:hypothetical protein K505DRAFT_411805 [Melanomma pulvis-pyrius CBS 109.77]|uniref:Fungal-type protein kinase domain-containing protein n=1 Tax=Melanomma pulvis-pyrius CBS 109.77 TaxID=1314802 RepID=A0A6A6WS72_9PLEO|nr:hypothetical protein K505DRAFT_411805 [Melanomma pulvis-pyrius CBS 109.77]